jgi:hypothetical protein
MERTSIEAPVQRPLRRGFLFSSAVSDVGRGVFPFGPARRARTSRALWPHSHIGVESLHFRDVDVSEHEVSAQRFPAVA